MNSYYTQRAGLAAATDMLDSGGDPALTTVKTASKWMLVYQVVGTVSMAVSAYHGYKRDDSVGWAIGWGLLGGLFPIITPVVAVAQGYAKPKKVKANRRRRTTRRRRRTSRRSR